MLLLENKVVFLTGGSEGIGLECASAYLKAGARVAIVANSEKSLKSAKYKLFKDAAIYLLADVTDSDQIRDALDETVAVFGKINVIHNNAGVSSPSKTLCETSDEEWDLLFNANVKGIYHTTRHGIEELKKNRGTILNTGSLVGDIGQQRHAAYTATKGAVNALTKSMALDYAPLGIRVNAIAPAGVWTPMLRTWSREQPDVISVENYLNEIHALGYCPEGDVVADASLFLISDLARFITGCVLPVTGGAELGYRKFLDQQAIKSQLDINI
jgi:meso-butanediol dehydrogenase/(S,S)-butanediol dehydrogenase/diacetyl reductase